MVTSRQLELELGGTPLQVRSQPGFEHWDAIDPAAALIAEHAVISHGERVLVWPCGHGALAVWAARQGDITCHAADTHLLAAEASQATAEVNGVDVSTIARMPALRSAPYDVLMIRAPKGRSAARMMLALARRLLAPTGRLYLAGGNKMGIKSVLKDAAELFGDTALLGYRRGHRVARFSVPNPDATPAWLTDGIRPGTFQVQSVDAAGKPLQIWSRPGVFSWQHLDLGTKLLLQSTDVAEAHTIADVGCGCGVIGAWAALSAPEANVFLSDVDALAVDCARRTLEANGLSHAQVAHADGLNAAPQACDLILSNPPFHAGHGIAYDMVTDLIERAPQHLAPGGRLVLVANRFLPYDRQMSQVFGNVKPLTQTAKFHVLQSIHRPKRKRNVRRSRR